MACRLVGDNFYRYSYIYIQEKAFEKVYEIATILSRPQCIYAQATPL